MEHFSNCAEKRAEGIIIDHRWINSEETGSQPARAILRKKLVVDNMGNSVGRKVRSLEIFTRTMSAALTDIVNLDPVGGKATGTRECIPG